MRDGFVFRSIPLVTGGLTFLPACNGDGDCGLQVGHASEAASDASGFETVGDSEAAGDPETFEFEPVSDRFWLVFITTLPGGGGGSASISEVTFGGP